ncbi:hypothetical protein PGB90_005343 [Kerria lacca]
MWLETRASDVRSPCLTANNLRHSASFSCLSRNNAQSSEKSYRARTATLSAVDLDYGFVIRPSEVCELPVNYTCELLPADSVIREIEAVKNERTNLLRKVLIKKSVSLLNPNVWWTPKFRRVKSSKNKDKNLQDIQSQKRWSSLGALLKISHSNNLRPSNMPQSSLPAQSFYLLDDFLKPSTNYSSNEDEQNAVILNDSSSNSLTTFSFSSAASGVKSQPAQHLGYKSSSESFSCKYHKDSSAVLTSSTTVSLFKLI